MRLSRGLLWGAVGVLALPVLTVLASWGQWSAVSQAILGGVAGTVLPD